MPEYLLFIQQYLSFFLTIINSLAIIASIVTFFFFMINKFSKALKYILSSYGFSLFHRIKVLFLCRKSPVKKRAFIEFAMLKSEGYGNTSSEWNSIINEFKAFYAVNEQSLIYTISNCTLLINEDFSIITKKYFDFFSVSKVKKAFGISNNIIPWVLKVKIEEAYLTPTCLLTGLLSKFEENWSEFIKRYVSTAYIAETNENNNIIKSSAILTNELYFTFAWLLWGPSYEIKYKHYWDGLCQISYGDESNSIPAITNINTDAIIKLKNEFINNRGHRYGILASTVMSIYKNKPYYKSIRNIINPENVYFFNKIEDGSLSFAVQIDELSISNNYKSKKYYCTAYVWLLFELEDETYYTFRPEKSISFFEHANLTDNETYNFLIAALLDKSIKHFTDIFSRPEYKGRKYRFVCAMNEEITASFYKRYNEIINSESNIRKEFKERIFLEPKHTPTDAFLAFDNFFSTSKSLSFIEVSLKDKSSISDLARFYTDIYIENFTDIDERESFDNLLYYLKTAESANEYRYRIILAKDNNNEIIAGGIFDYFTGPNSGVIEFIAVKTGTQSGGIGTQVYKQILNLMEIDAHQINNKKLNYVFCEINSPGYSKSGDEKYLHFWNKHNYLRLDFNYIQPSLSKSQAPVHGLWLIMTSKQNTDLSEVQVKLVADVIHDYMKYAMQIDNPNDNPDFIKMKEELSSKPIKFHQII